MTTHHTQVSAHQDDKEVIIEGDSPPEKRLLNEQYRHIINCRGSRETDKQKSEKSP